MAASDILIVDDEADIRELVAGILQDEGYETRTARDSDSALTSIGSRRPSLAVPRYLAAGLEARRAAAARQREGRAPGTAGGDDLRPRQHRDRRLGDQARCLRLHREAVQGGSARAGREPRAGKFPAQARGQGAQAARAAADEPGRQIAGDQPASPRDREGRADQQPHHDRRSVRRRQGTDRAHPSSALRRDAMGRSW